MSAPASLYYKKLQKSGDLTAIPDGWRIKKIDEIAVRGSGHTPDKEHQEYWHGNIPWVSLKDSNKMDKVFIESTSESISELGIANSSAEKHPAGSVVLCRDAGVGKCAIITKEMAVSQHFIAWKCGAELINLYLYYQLLSMRSEFERVAAGSTIVTIGLGYFRQMEMLVPPYQEQKKIAEILYVSDNSVGKLLALIEGKKKRRQGLMQRLLTGKRRFPGFTKPWQRVEIGAVLCEVDRPIEMKDDELYRLASVSRNWEGLFEREALHGRDIKTKNLREINAGDFLISHIQAAYGALALVPSAFNGFKVSNMYSCLRPKDPASFDVRFFAYLAQQPRMTYLCRTSSNGFFAERLRLNFMPEVFLQQTIDIPPTREEQHRIIAVLEAADREIALLEKLLAAYRTQKKGLMQQLLTGKRRVKVQAA